MPLKVWCGSPPPRFPPYIYIYMYIYIYIYTVSNPTRRPNSARRRTGGDARWANRAPEWAGTLLMERKLLRIC